MRLLLVFFILVLFGVHAQRHELQFHYRFGFPTENLKQITAKTPLYTNEYQNREMRTQFDQGGILSYKYKVWNKYKIFLNFGIEYSASKYYLPLIDGHFRLLQNIEVSYPRAAYHIGLNKQFEFYDSRLILDLGFQFVDRYPIHKQVDYISDFKTSNQDWIQYSYELNTYYGKYFANDGTLSNNKYIYLNADYNAHLKFRLKNNLFLNLGFSYTRNNFFFYNYHFTVLYYTNGSSTPTDTYTYNGLSGLFDPKFPVRDHFFYINTGVSFKFDGNKKKNPL